MTTNPRSVIIIGSGPAGYTAAIYAARANLNPLLFEGFFSGPAGGQLTTTTDVENFPGFPTGVSGPELVQKMREQAATFGTEFLTEDVVSVNLEQRPFLVQGSSERYTCHALIVASGATARRLEIPGTAEGEYWQKGVTACAVCDGAMPIFRNKPLFVIGGGDSAAEESLFLTRYASHVFLVHRRNALRASKIMQERLLAHPKVTVLWNSIVVRAEGDDLLRKVVLKDLQNGQETTHEAAGLFFAVGHVPNTDFLDGQIALHDTGYIRVKPGTCETSVEMVFAAGDVQDWVYRQAITAAGSGCMAAIECERALAEKGLQ